MDITKKIGHLLNEEVEGYDELNIMRSILDLIESFDDDILDDESYSAIGSAYESLLDVLISLETDDLDDQSSAALGQIFQDIEELEGESSSADEAYKPRKVASGRQRSSASRMTGSEKLKYIKRLKKNKKKYKNNATARRKSKKSSKKYRKSAVGKRKMSMYKHLNK